MFGLKIYYIKLYSLLTISTIVIVNCAPLQGDSEATILYSNYDNDGNGNYNFRFRTSNDITREETGTLVNVGLPNEHISVRGSYSYINPEGVLITLNYVANEKGYIILSPSKTKIAPYLYHLLIISALLIVTNCAPLQGDSEATILYYNYENKGNGDYNFRFGTSNGIAREETETLVDASLPNEHIYVQGTYSYINSEGETVTLNYTADENGYTILPPSRPPPQQSASRISPEVLASLLGK